MALIGWWGINGFSRCRKAMRIWCWRRLRAVCPAFCAALLPDGQRNAIRLERLKDKLGNRSNASCEVEFQDAIGWLLGQEGEGIRLILKMGGMTRFDCALGSHAMMRRAFSLAIYHAHQRHVLVIH